MGSSELGAAQRRQGGKDKGPGPEWGSELQSWLPPNLQREPGVIGYERVSLSWI